MLPDSRGEQNESGPSRLVLVIVLLMALIHAAVGLWRKAGANNTNDFLFHWIPARILAARQDANIYTIAGEQLVNDYRRNAQFVDSPDLASAISQSKDICVVSSPFLYSCFLWFSSGDFRRDLLLYRIVSFSGFLFMAFMWFRWLRYSLLYALMFLLFLTAFFGPLLRDAADCNANCLQLASLTVVLCLLSMRGAFGCCIAGLLLGLLTAYKPNLVFVPLVLYGSRLFRRQFRPLAFEVAGFAAGLLAAGLLAVRVFGSFSCWTDWLLRLKALEWSKVPLTDFNFSLSLIIWMRHGIRVTWLLVILLVVPVLAMLWFTSRRPLTAQEASPADCRTARDLEMLRDAQVVALGCLIYILSAPLVWAHYYTLCLPMLLITARPGLNGIDVAGWRSRIRMAFGLLFGLMVAVIPMTWLPRIPTLYATALVSWTGAFGLFCLGLWDMILIGSGLEVMRAGRDDRG